MEKTFQLEIISPAETVFKADAKSVTIPGSSGSFQVLANHAALISTFAVGMIKVQKDNDELLEYSTGGGIFEVKKNHAIVLAESIETKEEIDLERARMSKVRAEEILKSMEGNDEEKAQAKESLQRALNRIKTATGQKE